MSAEYAIPESKLDLNGAVMHGFAARAQSGDARAMNVVCEQAEPLVYHIAARRKGLLEHEDAMQVGMMAVPPAVIAYDPGRKRKLSAYLYDRVNFAIADGIRVYESQQGISRSEARDMRSAAKLYGKGKDREANLILEGLVKHGFIEVAQLVSEDGVNYTRWHSLDAPIKSAENVNLGETVRGGNDTEKMAINAVIESELRAAFESLSEREQVALGHNAGIWGYEYMPVAQVSEKLGVSERLVSQLTNTARAALREAMKPYGEAVHSIFV